MWAPMHKTLQEQPFGSAIHLFIPSRQLEGNLSEKISGLKQMTVKSLGEPDAFNLGLVIGSLLTNLSCLVLICWLIACPLCPPPPSCYCPFLFLSGTVMSKCHSSLGEMVLPTETQAPCILPASVQTHGL